MIMNSVPYPISFEQQMSQALVCRYGEEMRQYSFKPDIDVSGLSCLLQIAKTDGTFTENGVEVHTDPDTGECTLVITIPQQATVVKGLNRYSICVYGPIEGEDHLLYSAEGPLWVDDALITEEMIASVAEVNGLVFPQDFLTVENLVDIVNYVAAQLLDDESVSTEKTWSSEKISDEIEGHTPEIEVSKEASGNPIEFSDGAAGPLVKCVTAITGYQEGTGTPSPNNVRPIHAFSSGTILVADEDEVTQQTCTATFSNSIYQGNADFVGGSAECDMLVIDLGDLTWNASGIAQNCFYTYSITDYKFTSDTNMISSAYSFDGTTGTGISELANKPDCSFMVYYLAGRNEREIYFKDTRYTSASDFKNAVTGVKLAYELATPTTETITPTNLPIKSLFGYNHIESSTGDMEVEYITQTYQPIVDLIQQSSSHVYSTAEQVVGKWIDNKDIYEKTFILNTEITLTVNQWNSITGVTLSSVDTPINAEIRNSRGITFANIDFLDSPVSIWGQNGNEKVKSITFRYTKS